MKTDLKIIADVKEHEQTRVAILENNRLVELFIEYDFTLPASGFLREGDIFKARVDNILPAINAAFVALNSRSSSDNNAPRNAFLFLSNALSKTIKHGHEIIVQVVKNARKNKAPRVSDRISLPGRWVVLVPDSDEIGVSKRIFDPEERKRLKKIALDLKNTLADKNTGVIIRTAAEGISEEFLKFDLEKLVTLWNEIKLKAKNNNAPCLLYRDTGALGKVLRDEISGHIDEIILDDPEEFKRVSDFTNRFYPDKPEIKIYDGVTPIFECYGIESEIERAVDRKVWLKSGAYLVIDQAEALTVIDVNTGKFTSAPDMRHTVLATNLEAAEEIARQIRLRAIGGIVVVDFIDMEFDDDRNELLSYFEKLLCHDRLKAHVFSITQLGLVELTRKRGRQDLKSIMTRNCPLCGDNGWVLKEENIAMSVKRFIRKISRANNSKAFLIQVHASIAEYISEFLEDWEDEFNRKILIASMPANSWAWSKYRVEAQGGIHEVEERAQELNTQSNGRIIILHGHNA